MKTIFAILIATALGTQVYAQWLPDVRLTNRPEWSHTSRNGQRCLVSQGQTSHIVWFDKYIGNYLIYYKRTTNGGATWLPDTNLTLTNYDGIDPCIALSGQNIHVSWVDSRIGNTEIYYKRSTNGGINWLPDVRLTDNIYNSEQAVITATGSNVTVVWNDNRDNANELYYKHSTDDGATWTQDTRLTNAIGSSNEPAIISSGQNVYLVWVDSRNGYTEIYYNHSTDGGATWGTDYRLTNAVDFSYSPTIDVSGSAIHVAWYDYRDGNAEIYYKHSSDGGTTWSSDMRLTNDPSTVSDPSIAASGNRVHIVWQDNRNGAQNYELYYLGSTNGGVSFNPEVRLTNSAGESSRASVDASGNTVHLIWQDYRDNDYEIYYKQDPTGNSVGIQNISSEVPGGFSLEQNYPNPFNPVTNIKFSVPKAGHIRLTVFDITGRQAAVLVNEDLRAGIYNADFDGSQISSGVYYYSIEADGYREVKKMILVK